MDPQNDAPNPTTPQQATIALDDAMTTSSSCPLVHLHICYHHQCLN